MPRPTSATRWILSVLVCAVFVPFENFVDGARYAVSDGRHLVEVTAAGASVWNLNDGHLVVRAKSHRESVVRVYLSPDGHSVLTSSYFPPNQFHLRSKDDSIRLWSLSSGKEILCIHNATHGQFSLDGKRIYGFVRRPQDGPDSVASYLSSWDVRTGNQIFTDVKPGSTANLKYGYFLQENKQNHKLVFAQDGPCVLYDSYSGKANKDEDHLWTVGENAFFPPSGIEIQNATFEGVSYLPLTKGGVVKSVPYAEKGVWTVGWRRDGMGFAAVNGSAMVMAYDRITNRIKSAPSEAYEPRQVFMNPSGTLFVVNCGGVNGVKPRAFGFSTKTCIQQWRVPGQIVGFSNAGNAVILDDKLISFIECPSGRVVRSLTIQNEN